MSGDLSKICNGTPDRADRRVTILFEVAGSTVSIIGVYYGGQDYEADLRDDEE
jgi:hypothetical protein